MKRSAADKEAAFKEAAVYKDNAMSTPTVHQHDVKAILNRMNRTKLMREYGLSENVLMHVYSVDRKPLPRGDIPLVGRQSPEPHSKNGSGKPRPPA